MTAPTEELCPCCGKPRKPEPRKPREWWLEFSTTGVVVYDCELTGRTNARIHVREVIE